MSLSSGIRDTLASLARLVKTNSKFRISLQWQDKRVEMQYYSGDNCCCNFFYEGNHFFMNACFSSVSGKVSKPWINSAASIFASRVESWWCAVTASTILFFPAENCETVKTLVGKINLIRKKVYRNIWLLFKPTLQSLGFEERLF